MHFKLNLNIMKIYIAFILLLIVYTHSIAQKIQYPEFKGSQSSFQNYVLSELLKADTFFSKTCNTSLGLIQFSIDKGGQVTSIEISPSIPKEAQNKLYEIVSVSDWSVMKINNKAVDSLPIILPIYLSIELGCDDNHKGWFGLEKDFREMLNSKGKSFVNCILLDPFTYVLPIGFQDLDPKKD